MKTYIENEWVLRLPEKRRKRFKEFVELFWSMIKVLWVRPRIYKQLSPGDLEEQEGFLSTRMSDPWKQPPKFF